MIVLDASAFLDSVLHELAATTLETLALRSEIAVPDYFYIEVINGLRQLDLKKQLVEKQLEITLELIPHLPFLQINTATMTKEIWQLRQNISSYDAGYVALAKALSAPLVTHDQRLANAAEKWVKIERLMPIK